MFDTLMLADGLYLHILPDNRFSRVYMSAFLSSALTKEHASEIALLPKLLIRGTKGYPTSYELKRKLAELYGGSLTAGTCRMGDKQVLHFNLELTSDSAAGRPILGDGLALLAEIIVNPYLPSGYFDADYVSQEREQQIAHLRAVQDDKESWAVKKALETLFRGESFNVSEDGELHRLQELSPENLTAEYLNIVQRRIDIYMAGAFDPAEAANTALRHFGGLKRDDAPPEKTPVLAPCTDIMKITIEEQTVQSWVVLGMKTGIPLHSRKHPGLCVTNTLLGGGDQSRLFRIVRETAGLAYECGTIFDKATGVIIAAAGVDRANMDRTADIMLNEIEQVTRGNITDTEFTIARETLSGALRSAMDDPGELMREHYLGLVEGLSQDMRITSGLIEGISKDAAMRSAGLIRPDTLLFLSGMSA